MPNMQGFTYIDLAVLIVYLLAVLLAGLHFAKKEMKGKEYFKGDGTVPWWVTSVSIFATLLSPISFLSLAGNSYAGTWIMWFAQLGMLLAIPLTIKFFLPIYSKLDIDTAYHYLELRFNSKFLRVLGAVMFIIYQVGRMSIIMYLPCMVLSSQYCLSHVLHTVTRLYCIFLRSRHPILSLIGRLVVGIDPHGGCSCPHKG